MFGSNKYTQHSLILFAYFFINFSMLCGGNLHVLGPLSLRHLCTVFLGGIVVLYWQRVKLKNLALSLYLGYIFVYFVCNIINGEFVFHSFWQSLYTYHLPCVALALGLPIIIKNVNHVKIFVWSLVGLYVFDSILSFFQYTNLELAWVIATRISSQAEGEMETAQMYLETSDNLLGYSLVAGAFGFVVTNAYFLSTYLPVITYRVNKKGTINMIVSGILLVLAGYTIFLTQQRMAFLSFVLFLLFFVCYGMKMQWRIPVILIVVFLSYYGLSNIEMGRLTTDTNNVTRMRIFENFYDFLGRGNVLFGGAEAYFDVYKKSQHNTFLAAWTSGGIFSFILFVFLYFRLLRNSLKILFMLKRKRFHYPYTFCFSLASVIFLFYSTTHSAGVQSGSPMFWIVYTMMCISFTLERKTTNIIHGKIIN